MLRNANLVENYPGFPGGISGRELVRRIEKQLREANLTVAFEEVKLLDFSDGVFEITTAMDRSFCANRVVIASGTAPVLFSSLGIPVSAENRVFYEVYPLRFVHHKKVVVVGAGDAAFDYALNLAGRDNQVSILNRGAAVKCLPLLWERANACPKIRYFPETSVAGVREDAPGGSMTVECAVSGRTVMMGAHFVLFAIGREPQLSYLSPRIDRQKQELTSAGRLFFAGDVKNDIYRQTAIAAGDGILSAMKIYQGDLHESVCRSRL